MSAAVLREAAELMRSRAEAATQVEERGDWDAYVLGSEGYAVMGAPRKGRVVRTFVARCGMNDWDTDKQNAEHIASWHPLVALAVADWLEVEADEADRYSGEGAPQVCCGRAYRDALAVSRAYLGGVS